MSVLRQTVGRISFLCVVVLAGCAQKGPPPLYMWEGFPRQQYEALLKEGFSAETQIQNMEAHAEKARAANAALPPGFRAHLGMLQLASGNPGRAKDLWEQEKLAFPESAPYMDQLLKKLSPPSPAVSSINPA